MDPYLDFSGQTILISGAAAGFGAGLATELAKRGAQLVISDINEVGLKEVARELADNGAKVLALKCDVTDAAQCQAVVEAAVEEFGQVDIAINNAGGSHPLEKMAKISPEVLDQVLNLNTKGVFYAMAAQLKQMEQQKHGHILNLSSMAGVSGAPLMSAYSAAKHAVIGLTKSAALEYATHGIRVNAACPYAIEGTAIGSTMGNESAELFFQRCCAANPMKRIGKLNEAIAAMVMILSPANSFMNGQSIAIDGGISAR